jgi:UDP-N-acetyl-D-glucosamine dehydrogenase
VADGHTPAGAVGKSVAFTDAALRNADAVMVVTDHSAIDYARVCAHAQLVIDTRHACTSKAPKRSERPVVAHA